MSEGEMIMPKIRYEDGKYLFDAEDGSAQVECKVWAEKSKATEAHPEGKPWIVLPKGNITNRTFFSLDKFEREAINECIEVEVKTSGPRVLGSTGVKQSIIKFLSEEEATEYTDLVNKAVEAYKAAKMNSKKKKPEDMSIEELEAYVTALKNGTKITVSDAPKSFIDMFDDSEYARYNELLAIAQENKANAPKAVRGPLTEEEKAARKIKRAAKELSKAEQLLAALKAAQTSDVDDEDIDDDYDM